MKVNKSILLRRKKTNICLKSSVTLHIFITCKRIVYSRRGIFWMDQQLFKSKVIEKEKRIAIELVLWEKSNVWKSDIKLSRYSTSTKSHLFSFFLTVSWIMDEEEVNISFDYIIFDLLVLVHSIRGNFQWELVMNQDPSWCISKGVKIW